MPPTSPASTTSASAATSTASPICRTARRPPPRCRPSPSASSSAACLMTRSSRSSATTSCGRSTRSRRERCRSNPLQRRQAPKSQGSGTVPTFVFLLLFATSLRVGRITVTTVPLFSAEEAGQSTFYGVANRLAVPTRAGLVRKFLLFHEGEPYDPARLRESERALRALDFLKTVTITPLPPHDRVVDITVAP